MQLDLLQKELDSVTQCPRRDPPEITPTQNKAEEKPMQPTSPQPEEPSQAPHDGLDEKDAGAFKTISEAATILDVPQHVLRFWESRFSQIKPLKMRGGRRYYRPQDMEILSTIKNLLYKQGYTINGARKAFSSHGHPQPALEPEVQEAKVKKALTDKQHSQLSVIRQELMGLRDTLKPLVQKK